MSTMHIFGMAKSSLNLKGAKRQKVELDYLRLVYACLVYPASEAYLVVTDTAMENTVLKWAKKYKADGVVNVKVLPTEKLTTELRAEKKRNVRGMVDAINGKGLNTDAVAALGEQICEEYLLELMQAIYPAIGHKHHCQKKIDYRKLPLGVNWDFYAEY